MFESIIGYSEICKQCAEFVRTNSTPSVFLISGNRYAGKCSIALEFSRLLLCERTTEEISSQAQCMCNSCMLARKQNHPDIKVLGNRNFSIELDAVFNAFIANKQEQTRQALLQVLRKLLARADFIVWEDTEVWSSGIKSASAALADQLYKYETMETDEWQRLSVSVFTDIYKAAVKLIQSFPEQMYTVKGVRNIISWAKVSSRSNLKIVIFEYADKMSSMVENMLLKTLEESPQNTIFFVLSDNPYALLETTRSRLFHLSVPQRSIAQELQVIEQILGVTQEQLDTKKIPIKTIRDFMQHFSQSQGNHDVSMYADRYLHALQQHKHFDATLLEFLRATHTKQSKLALFFLEMIRTKIHQYLFTSQKYATALPLIWKTVEETYIRIEKYHVSPKYILESLYYSLAQWYEKFSL